MPIYEYRCSDCSFQDEYLQKLSDPPMTVCPACGKAAFTKLLSAVGFQLKGSGWYATDFKGSGGKPAAKPAGDGKSEAQAETKTEAKSEAKAESKSEAAGSKTGGEKTAASTPTAPAAG